MDFNTLRQVIKTEYNRSITQLLIMALLANTLLAFSVAEWTELSPKCGVFLKIQNTKRQFVGNGLKNLL